MRIASIIAAVTFVFNICSASPRYENKQESDSAILARHIWEAKTSNSPEEFSEHSFNAGISDEQLDSILLEDGIRITGGSVYYSPDSVFKIFVVEGESCGAYCNPYDQAWLHFNDGSQLVINDADFGGTNIEIFTLPNQKYLIIESFWGRPAGYYTITGHSARIISFDNHKLVTHQGFKPLDMNGDSLMYGQSQPHVIDSSEYLTYDPKTQQLNYRYGYDPAINSEDGNAYIRKGYFKLEGDIFIEKDHEISPYTVKE